MIAQPRDFAELTMLAKRNSVFLHAANMVRASSQYNKDGGHAGPGIEGKTSIE